MEWKERHQFILKEIERKKQFLKQQEEKIDLSRPDKYNLAIINRLKQEGEFINSLFEYMIHTEDLINNMVTLNKHLEVDCKIYKTMMVKYEQEFEKEYERSLRSIQPD